MLGFFVCVCGGCGRLCVCVCVDVGRVRLFCLDLDVNATAKPFISQPSLLQFVRIKLVEASDRVLMMFDEALQQEAVKQLSAAPQKLLEQVRAYVCACAGWWMGGRVRDRIFAIEKAYRRPHTINQQPLPPPI